VIVRLSHVEEKCELCSVPLTNLTRAGVDFFRREKKRERDRDELWKRLSDLNSANGKSGEGINNRPTATNSSTGRLAQGSVVNAGDGAGSDVDSASKVSGLHGSATWARRGRVWERPSTWDCVGSSLNSDSWAMFFFSFLLFTAMNGPLVSSPPHQFFLAKVCRDK
jgi:hypothetical protein